MLCWKPVVSVSYCCSLLGTREHATSQILQTVVENLTRILRREIHSRPHATKPDGEVRLFCGGVVAILLKMSIVSGYNILVSILFLISILLTTLQGNEDSLGFGLLVGHVKQFIDVTLGSEKM